VGHVFKTGYIKLIISILIRKELDLAHMSIKINTNKDGKKRKLTQLMTTKIEVARQYQLMLYTLFSQTIQDINLKDTSDEKRELVGVLTA